MDEVSSSSPQPTRATSNHWTASGYHADASHQMAALGDGVIVKLEWRPLRSGAGRNVQQGVSREGDPGTDVAQAS